MPRPYLVEVTTHPGGMNRRLKVNAYSARDAVYQSRLHLRDGGFTVSVHGVSPWACCECCGRAAACSHDVPGSEEAQPFCADHCDFTGNGRKPSGCVPLAQEVIG